MYKLDIWYAEHRSEGDKFFKTLAFKSPTGKVFGVSNYGPRSVHVNLDQVSTGQSVFFHGDDVITKKREKRNGGYSKNEQVREHSFVSLADLETYVRSNIKNGKQREVLNAIKQPSFDAGIQASAGPIFTEPESRLHESAEAGTW